MANIFTLENLEDFSEKLNIDELFEKKKQSDLNRLALFNKILNRVHVTIKTASRQSINTQFCWFLVPEFIIGVPRFDQGACIAYLINKLQSNGFVVQYTHPNLLFISWSNFVPSYVRTEWKKKTGITIDEFGKQVVEKKDDDETEEQAAPSDPNEYLLKRQNGDAAPPKKSYTPIKSYRPSGNLVYDDDVLHKIENRFA